MYDDEDDEDFSHFPIEHVQIEPARLEAIDAVVIGANFLADIASAFQSLFRNISNFTGLHSAWKTQQRDFHQKVAQDIETL